MATGTCVFTYTVGVASGTAEKEAKVTSFTYDNGGGASAYAALTDAEVIEAATMFRGALAALVADAKMPATGWSGRDVTS